MKATVLIDNISNNGLQAEWGLAINIEYKDNIFLLDAGTTGIFADNAKELGVDLSKVKYAALSHAHYDHADGFEAFFEQNKYAKLYIREGSGENCYHRHNRIFHRYRYIGIKKGMLDKYSDRIVYAGGDYPLCEGVALIGHKTKGLDEIGKDSSMYVKMGRKYRPDDYAHEQSLVFETEKGLVVFNSCSHGGIDNIIREVQETYPDKKIIALIGGLHLYRKTDEEILLVAEKIKTLGIEKVITGHCTGEHAYQLLKEQLGDTVEQIYTGLKFSF